MADLLRRVVKMLVVEVPLVIPMNLVTHIAVHAFALVTYMLPRMFSFRFSPRNVKSVSHIRCSVFPDVAQSFFHFGVVA